MPRSPKSQSRTGKTVPARIDALEAQPKPGDIIATAAVATAASDGPAIDAASLLFDPDWYRIQYPDVAAAGVDPIRHYFDDGAREGRDPNPFFSTGAYVARYPDVAASRMNPFLHYLLYGAREGRSPRG